MPTTPPFRHPSFPKEGNFEGGIRGRNALRPYKEYIHAITPHGKGLGVGASVRTLPGAGKERMFERSEFLAPAANGFVRIAPKTQPLIFFFVTFFLHQGKKESEWIRGRSTLRPYNVNKQLFF